MYDESKLTMKAAIVVLLCKQDPCVSLADALSISLVYTSLMSFSYDTVFTARAVKPNHKFKPATICFCQIYIFQ